ncbi:universal stress protein [Methylorubrum thiocyanatum]|uniref:universal stress protein n=1 Tax=Methylorubrum thiocyanatum TaxID=47958 RepID=UPI0035C867B2
MSYANVMTSVDPLLGCACRIRLAARVAQRLDALLTGVAARQIPVPLTRTSFREQEEIRAAERALLDEDLAALKALFLREAGQVVRTVWQQAGIAATDHFIRRGRGADLLVVGRHGPADGEPRAETVQPAPVLVESGRPVLVVPPGVERLEAERVVVAWKDTPEARRAVGAALPLLRLATSVSLVSVGPTASEEGGEEVAELLALHGIHATSTTRPVPEGLDETDVLLAFVEQARSDLLVLGAYGHGRLREWVFGGVTRSILQRSPVCCLMTH